MTEKILTSDQGVTLLGGGPATPRMILDAVVLAPNLVAADGGANHLVGGELVPSAIIGDLDSLKDRDQWRAQLGDNLVHVAEQESTDFEKCLARIDAPFFVCVGFLGGRQDHGLAALHTLINDPRPIVLIGDSDVAFAAHCGVSLALEVGERISIFPMRTVRAIGGAGLKYPVDGLRMEAGAQIGVSNEAAAPGQSFGFDRPGAIVFLNAGNARDALQAQGALFHSAI